MEFNMQEECSGLLFPLDSLTSSSHLKQTHRSQPKETKNETKKHLSSGCQLKDKWALDRPQAVKNSSFPGTCVCIERGKDSVKW